MSGGLRLGRWRLCGTLWRPQWAEWFTGNYNWRNFTVIRFDIEAGPADGYKGRYVELTVGVLGFVFDVELYDVIDRAAALSPVERRMQDWEERHPE